ncbi:hypothetical protein J6590_064634 [Homalodisca vitripennis]|nr:hypothetical protein J6590_064634 [Homalodisca vitripennis]
MTACYSLWRNVKSEENKLRYNAALKRYRDNLKTEKAKWYNKRIEESDNKPKESWNIVNVWANSCGIGSTKYENKYDEMV